MPLHLQRYPLAIVTALAFSVAPLRADESYYMILFAWEGPSGAARDAHTFAAFVKSEKPDQLGAVHSISWLPATADVRLLRRPEAGTNFGLKETLQRESFRGGRVVGFGPYRIDKELYQKALAQIDKLNSGKIAYKALDRRFRPENATNCFHAISDMVPGPLLDTGSAFGVTATAMVRDHLGRWILDENARHPWVSKALGLDEYRITYVDR